MARIIDGKRIAKEIRQELQEEVAMLKERHQGFMPGLAIVQIGDSCDSNHYIKFQLAAAAEIGIVAVHYKLPSSSSLAEVVHKINDLNNDPRIHGILVQMPPESDEPMDQDALLNAVSPEKDVDGLTDHNAGKLARGELGQCFLPCTPRGCMELLKRSGVDVEGKRVAVLGRSKIVGAPMSDLLRAHNATVTMCHSHTKNINEIIRESDVIVVGIQQPCFVQKEWIKPGAVVIDCGINFINDATTGSELEEDDPFSKTGRKMVGDVDYNGVREVAGAITPVPGGVGPMTMAMLMGNTVESAKRTVEGTLGDQWKMRYLPLGPKDPVPSDIEVSRAQKPKEVSELAQELQLLPSEIDSYGKTKTKISLTVLDPLKDRAPGKYIVVGGKNVFACVSQPSQGPTFGIKGGAAGGGYAQVIPMEEAQPRRVCRRNKRHANFQRALALVTQGLPLRRAALKCDIPESTLRDRYHGRTKSSMVPGRGTMLTPDDERALVEHLEKLASYGYGLTKTQVLHLATDMADELGRRSAKVKGRLFTKTWFRLFRKRWPKLRIKSPSKLEMNRAKGTTKEALSSYFQELERTMEEHNLKDKPDRIYNVDETNLNAEHKPPKVTTGADIRINSITSHRIGTTSLLACGNAAGRSLPPYYVFKGKQRIPELLSGALPGSKMFMTSSGWSNSTVFRDYLENHFIPALPPRAENEFVMLMYDGHTSHICKPVIEFAREHKIVLFVLPAHTSHVTQPPDVGCFASLKVSYHAECARYMQENPGEVITRYDIARLSSAAYLRALREKNLRSAFRKAGIFPLDPARCSAY